ncbi:hypothetical protein EHQ92_10075 [Leptospira biflexa]|uniref:transmembrane 220 family protein n=1 Tax=Leptospira biflexa TaxID=172 RepID=UPI0010912B63|nr:transmembrane 220 family protein [Leptospira biflexa]TGM48210.1 hypothetical protein EHQ92_10075 [Leptospira biflexa]TGM49324.1 hypothetical protein EHQ88_03005 [Leptospira biflexa]
MKLFSLLCVPIFFLFAYLQLNDPDPYVWFPIYAIVGIFAGIRIFRRLPKWIGFGIIPLYLVLSVYYATEAPYFGMEVEEVRESLGLLIAAGAVWLLVFKK